MKYKQLMLLILIIFLGCDASKTMPVIDTAWESGEEKVCITTPNAVIENTSALVLLCDNAFAQWTIASIYDESYGDKSRSRTKKVLKDARFFQVRLIGSGKHVKQDSLDMTIWNCTKHLGGTIDCETK
jgi:hypothetical protein